MSHGIYWGHVLFLPVGLSSPTAVSHRTRPDSDDKNAKGEARDDSGDEVALRLLASVAQKTTVAQKSER